jgi:hypothetical protein
MPDGNRDTGFPRISGPLETQPDNSNIRNLW